MATTTGTRRFPFVSERRKLGRKRFASNEEFADETEAYFNVALKVPV